MYSLFPSIAEALVLGLEFQVLAFGFLAVLLVLFVLDFERVVDLVKLLDPCKQLLLFLVQLVDTALAVHCLGLVLPDLLLRIALVVFELVDFLVELGGLVRKCSQFVLVDFDAHVLLLDHVFLLGV